MAKQAYPVMAEAQPVHRRRSVYISLRVKLFVGFTLLFSVMFAGAFYWFYTFSTNNALAFIQESLKDTITGAVAGLNGDDFQALVQQGQRNAKGLTDDPRYQAQLNWLSRVHDVEPRAYPYTYIAAPDKDGKKVNDFIVDYLQIADPSRAAGFKEPYTLQSGVSRDGLQQLSFKMTPYSDKWGTWVSAYAPIKNSAGQVVGGMGVDFRADYVYQVQRGILDKVALAFGVTYVIFFLAVWLMTRTITKPMRALTRAARRIGEGDYSQSLTFLRGGRVRDEVSSMSEVFDLMVEKVAQREQTLVRRVEQLTIQIDEVKRQQEVSAIVDSDTFVELQAKAKLLRERRLSQVVSSAV